MKNIKHIQNTLLIIFLITGIIHITSGLMMSNYYLMPLSMIVNNVLDIPFAMTALSYAFISIYTELEPNHQKIAGPTFFVITLIIFVFLLYINLFIPDKPIP